MELIRKYYIIQLIIGFTLTVFIINISGSINLIDDYSKGQLLVLSIVGGFLYTLLNGSINALNFTYGRKKNPVVAFYLPILLWFIILTIDSIEIVQSGSKTTDWLFVLIWIEPILYNLLVYKAVANKK